jgi:hypothetical protein
MRGDTGIAYPYAFPYHLARKIPKIPEKITSIHTSKGTPVFLTLSAQEKHQMTYKNARVTKIKLN